MVVRALNQLDASSTGSTGFRTPRPLSSALAALGTLQPRALGVLNPVDPWTRCLTSIYTMYMYVHTHVYTCIYMYLYMYIVCVCTLASMRSQPGLGGGCLKRRVFSIMCNLSSMSPAFFCTWLASDSNLVILCSRIERNDKTPL